MSDNKGCGLLRLPPEIRIRIYEYVLQPEATVKTPCCSIENRHDSFSGISYLRIQPSSLRSRIERSLEPSMTSGTVHSEWVYTTIEPLMEGHLVGSTCELRSSTIRDMGDAWPRDFPAHSQPIEILCTNRQVYHEAAAVLYEQCRVCVRRPDGFIPWSYPTLSGLRTLTSLSAYAASHIRHFHLEVDFDHDQFLPNAIINYATLLPRHLPSVRIFSIHIDVDLTYGKLWDAAIFKDLHILAESVTFIIDVHITRDWNGNGSGWEEPVATSDVKEDKIAGINRKAEILRDAFVESLSLVFMAHGKTLRMT